MATYPEFQLLPREIKRFLLASENYFYDEAKTPIETTGIDEFSAIKPLINNWGQMPPPNPRHFIRAG